MARQELIVFLVQVSVMLGAALIFGHLARRLRLPAVLGELVGGIVIGPTLLGALAPGFFAALFPASGPASMARDALIRVGLLCFLFVAGLEVNLSQMRKLGWTIAWTSFLGIAFPFAIGFALVLAFPRSFGPQAAAHGVLYPLFLGTAMSISALPVIARILMDLSLTRTRLGMVVMAAATIDDLIGWSLFAVILSKVSPIGIEGQRSLGGTLFQVLAPAGRCRHPRRPGRGVRRQGRRGRAGGVAEQALTPRGAGRRLRHERAGRDGNDPGVACARARVDRPENVRRADRDGLRYLGPERADHAPAHCPRGSARGEHARGGGGSGGTGRIVR